MGDSGASDEIYNFFCHDCREFIRDANKHWEKYGHRDYGILYNGIPESKLPRVMRLLELNYPTPQIG